MNNKVAIASSGISLSTTLFLIFFILKLAKVGEVANWSWWWVTSPLWIPPLVVVVGFVLGAIGALIAKVILETFFKP